jgi:lactate dehydrogenase-like 2-hydroxyacid dehydrogenase
MVENNKIIVIGNYTDWQIKKLKQEFDPFFLKTTDDLLDVPNQELEQIQGVAFQGHRSFDKTKFDLLPNLKIVSNFGVGFDAIDVDEATKRGIKVTNTPDVLNDDVADLAVGMLIALSREFTRGVNWVNSGDWGKFGEMPLNRKISGRKVGILGLGRIGREIADRLVGFKMDIHYHSRTKKETPNDWNYHSDPVSLAREVDFLFVALVGGEKTHKYASKEVIQALGSDGILINISRGSTIDEDALLDALENRKIRGAALDVFIGEPNLNSKFLELENVFLQPPQGSGTVESREAMSKLQRDNLLMFYSNKNLLTPVN